MGAHLWSQGICVAVVLTSPVPLRPGRCLPEDQTLGVTESSLYDPVPVTSYLLPLLPHL